MDLLLLIQINTSHFILICTVFIDNLFRIMWYGFKEMVSDFLTRNPGHHINAKRLNGSAVEIHQMCSKL